MVKNVLYAALRFFVMTSAPRVELSPIILLVLSVEAKLVKNSVAARMVVVGLATPESFCKQYLVSMHALRVIWFTIVKDFGI